ncbi:MAG: ribose-phosphate diphosphokinase [Rhodospirillaceae bacterium]
MPSDNALVSRPDTVLGFPENQNEARRLADLLRLDCGVVALHHFPDGESRVTVPAHGRYPLVLRSLRHPNAKLVELCLTGGALRDGGAQAIMLVTPYLAYMRQDIAFSSGEAVSQRIIGGMLAAHFDSFVSVDPHLHRTPSLDKVFAGAPALAVSAAPAIVAAIKAEDYPDDTIILGPDEESQAWVKAVAEPLGLPWATSTKHRIGDRDVRISLPTDLVVRGRRVVLVDDLISTGSTITQIARILTEAGAGSIDVFATHALFSQEDHQALHDAGVRSISSCNTALHPTNTIDILPTLATGLEQWLSH